MLWRWRGNTKKRCICDGEVAEALEYAHNESGHYAIGIMARKLKEYHWPHLLKDIEDYILGRLS